MNIPNKFQRSMAGLIMAVVLSACASAPAPTAVPPTVAQKPTSAAVPTSAPVPTAAPAPTTAPAPTAVPKPTVAPPTEAPKPTAAPAAAGKAADPIFKGNSSKTGGQAELPVAVQFVGLSKGDLVLVGNTTCLAEREKVTANFKALLDSGVKIDISGAATSELSFDGTTAVVELNGVKGTKDGTTQAFPPAYAKVIQEDGKWVICGSATPPPPTAAEAPATGAITADLGFRPPPNGLPFENYGDKLKDGTVAVNMTPAEVVRLFGDGVCASGTGDSCILTPAGEQWLAAVNKAMDGGHCEGFAVLASLFYAGLLKPSDFGAETAADLKIADNPKLQREIALWFATQGTPPSAGTERKDLKPVGILELIKTELAKGKDGEFYVLGVYQPGYKQGHAITAYAIKEDGDIARILVYDNNWPGKERYVTIDRKAGTWTYNAAINPSAPSSEYKGDDTTFTLTAAPIRIRIPQQKCPFCAASATADVGRNGVAAAAIEFNEIWMNGAANLLITDAAGKRLGQVGGKLVNEIPGAYFQPIKSGDLYTTDDEPAYFIPRGTKFTVTLDGSELKKDAPSSVTMIGPGYVLEVADIVIKPAQKDTISFSPDGTEMTYATTSKETPDLILGTETTGADYEFFVSAQGEANGQQITLKLEAPQGRLAVSTKSLEANTTYDLKMKRIDKAGEQDFHAQSVELGPSATDYVMYADWTGNHQALKIGLDKTGDGKIDETISVADTK